MPLETFNCKIDKQKARKYIDNFGFQNKITLKKARSIFEASIKLPMTEYELRKEI
jgi:adenylate cyclase class IV